MWLAVIANASADSLFYFGGRQEAVWFHNPALGMHPVRLNAVEPGALDGQVTRQETDSLAGLFDLAIVTLNPDPHSAAAMPRSVIPDHTPDGFAQCLERATSPC